MGNTLADDGRITDDNGIVLPSGRCRDMSPPQLARYDGSGEDVHAYVGINGDIYDVTKTKGDEVDKYGSWFGKNKQDATAEEVSYFAGKYTKLGKVIKQRIVSMEELNKSTGVDGRPIYIAARGLVFDVSTGESFYGPDGGGYKIFAGRNAQRALALMSLKIEDVDNTNIDDLSDKDLKILDDWISKYYDKYPLVGTLESVTPTPTAAAVDTVAKTSSETGAVEGETDVAVKDPEQEKITKTENEN